MTKAKARQLRQAVGTGAMRSAHLRHAASAASVPMGTPQAPLEHKAATYRSGKCKCTTCREDHNRLAREYEAARRAGTHESRADRKARILKEAQALLEDGCSYREAAVTVHTDQRRLKAALPGFDDNNLEWMKVLTQIKNDEKLLQMHRIVWQGANYAQS